jgi:hypothetical protein
MRPRQATRRLTLGAFALLAAASGCGPLVNVARTVFVEPCEYCPQLDAYTEKKRDERMAAAAWCRVQKSAGEPLSEDYGDGYQDGYVDYLFAGDPANPPALPPRRYFRARYETPVGHRAIEDWYAGYQRGVADARQSGLRQLVTVPTPVPGPLVGDRLPNPVITGPPRDFEPAPAIIGPAMTAPPLDLPPPAPLPDSRAAK